MKEIGGYMELDTYGLPMLHRGALALNCGRNCLAFLAGARKIRRIALPYFLCGCVGDVCRREGVETRHYHIGPDFRPVEPELREGEWLYVVNYYGQLDDRFLEGLAERHGRVIVDNAQAYFRMPAAGVDTLYTCRKFFGVADGAFLYTDAAPEGELPRDESFGRMNFLLGRYEHGAAGVYPEYVRNDLSFGGEPVRRMSRLTENLLHGIDYGAVERRRTENFRILHGAFREVNRLELSVPEGAFMYPLYIRNGAAARKRLLEEKIYIPTLWPDAGGDAGERDMAENILPLPVDQRYGREEMEYMVRKINHVRKEL